MPAQTFNCANILALAFVLKYICPRFSRFTVSKIFGFFHLCSKNAIAMAKSGQVASSDLAAIKSGGKSIDELTGMCLGRDKNSVHL